MLVDLKKSLTLGLPCATRFSPALFVLGMAVLSSSASAQSTTTPAPNTQQQADPAKQAPTPKGQVLFERHEADPVPDATPAEAAPPATTPAPTGVSSSDKHPRGLRRREAPPETSPDDSVVVTTPADTSSSAKTSAPEAPGPIVLTAADRAAAAKISQEQRRAARISTTDLDLHLNSHTGAFESRAQITVRNEGDTPLTVVPLRISGALKWESARILSGKGAGVVAPLVQYHVADDLDHTGAATELALQHPLAPGASVQLDLYYGGVMAQSATRLTAMGAPEGRAALTDWDTVSDTFTGIRGLGDVLWYPVTEPPAMLADGAAVTAAVESSRARDAANTFRLRLTLEYIGSRPDAAFFCGERKPLKPLGAEPDAANPPEGGVVTADWNRKSLGPHTPSLFVASGAPQTVAGGLLRVVTDRADTAAALGEAATKVRPMLAEWLGATPVQPLDVIDLPVPSAAGFTDGGLLVAPLNTAPAASMAPRLIQPLANAWLPVNIQAAWLRDGLPAFLQAVWAERTEGRGAALSGLAAQSKALQAQYVPPQPTTDAASSSSSSSNDDPTVSGPALAVCADPACTRGKASYVLEMLRDMLGDAAMQQALSGWRVAVETMPNRTAADETAALERLLQQTAGKRDLGWFFSDWIDTEKSLPELSIVTVAPRKVERTTPTNYLPPKQAYGGPLGPEPVPKPGDPDSVAPRSTSPNDRSIAPGSWMVAVEVQNNGGADVEVPVTVRAGGLTNTLPLKVPAHGRATIRVPFEAEPEEVTVNDGSVPERIAMGHRRSLHGLSQ